MRKLAILTTLISLTVFFACNKQEIQEDIVSINQEVTVTDQTAEDIAMDSGEASFRINDDDDILENDVLMLTNNSINAISYHWDFGNGDTSSEANPNYQYKIHGNYTVELTVSDAHDNIHRATQEIIVLCLFGGETHESND